MLTEHILKKNYALIEPTEENLKHSAETIHRYMMAQTDAYEACGRDLDDVYLANIAKFIHPPIYQSSDFIDSVRSSEADLVAFMQKAIDEGYMTCSIDIVEFAFIITSLASGMLHSWITYGEGYSLHETADKVLYDLIQTFIK